MSSRRFRKMSDLARYACASCDYETEWRQDLKRHRDLKHGGGGGGAGLDGGDAAVFPASEGQEYSHGRIMYPCHLCDYQSRLRIGLRRHVRRVHKEARTGRRVARFGLFEDKSNKFDLFKIGWPRYFLEFIK